MPSSAAAHCNWLMLIPPVPCSMRVIPEGHLPIAAPSAFWVMPPAFRAHRILAPSSRLNSPSVIIVRFIVSIGLVVAVAQQRREDDDVDLLAIPSRRKDAAGR